MGKTKPPEAAVRRTIENKAATGFPWRQFFCQGQQRSFRLSSGIWMNHLDGFHFPGFAPGSSILQDGLDLTIFFRFRTEVSLGFFFGSGSGFLRNLDDWFFSDNRIFSGFSVMFGFVGLGFSGVGSFWLFQDVWIFSFSGLDQSGFLMIWIFWFFGSGFLGFFGFGFFGFFWIWMLLVFRIWIVSFADTKM
jgi:hypothetical protein